MKTISIKNKKETTLSQMKDFEQKIQIQLPKEYKNFLLKSETLKPDTNPALGEQYENYKLKETIIFGELYDFQKVIDMYHEYDYFENNRIDLYDKTILIGEEINNGYFYMRMPDKENYEIGFWDHDYIMSEYQEETDDDELINERMNPHNMYPLSNNFQQFLNSWTLSK